MSGQEVFESSEAQCGEVMKQLAREKGALAALRASLEERVSHVEDLLKDSVDRHGSMTDHQIFTSERVEKLKDELTRNIVQLWERDMHEFREQVGAEKLARERHHSSVQDLVLRERIESQKLMQQLPASY